MRRTLLAATVFLMLTAAASAVVDPGNQPEGDMHIMDTGSSSSASQGVGPNGTTYRAAVSQRNASCSTGQNDSLTVTGEEDVGGMHRVAFRGIITTATPCHTLAHDVVDRGDGVYILNITTEPSGPCAQCLGAVTYTGSFTSPDGFRLIVQHDGRHVRTITSAGYNSGLMVHPSPLDRFLAWITGLL